MDSLVEDWMTAGQNPWAIVDRVADQLAYLAAHNRTGI